MEAVLATSRRETKDWSIQMCGTSLFARERPNGKFDLSISFALPQTKGSMSIDGVEPILIGRLRSSLESYQSFQMKLPESFREVMLTTQACSLGAHRMVLEKASSFRIPEGMYNSFAKEVDNALSSAGVENLLSLCEVSEPRPNIVAIWMPFRPMLSAMFMRPQEYYENPDVSGKVFSREAFAELYADKQSYRKEFTYYLDYSGFNFPDTMLRPFTEKGAEPNSPGELALFHLLNDKISSDKSFYVIGSSGDRSTPSAKETLEHEIRHGLFHTNEHYRSEVCKIIYKPEYAVLLPALFKFFHTDGNYHPKVWIDEAQAYLGGATEELIQNVEFSAEVARLLPVIREDLIEVLNAVGKR